MTLKRENGMEGVAEETGYAMHMLLATRDVRKVSLWLAHASLQSTEAYLVVPEKAGFQAVHAEASNGLRTKACQILRQKILRYLRISRKFCPAPHRIPLMASPWLPLR